MPAVITSVDRLAVAEHRARILEGRLQTKDELLAVYRRALSAWIRADASRRNRSKTGGDRKAVSRRFEAALKQTVKALS